LFFSLAPHSQAFSRVVAATAALALVAAGVLVAQPAVADSVVLQSGELVVNGDAEQVPTVGWTGPLSRATHGVGGYPAAVIVNNKGLTGRTFAGGAGMFFGSGGVSTATQIISLGASAPAIDNGEVDALLSAYIGGYSTQADNAQVTYTFRDSESTPLSTVTFGPVLVGDRAGVSGFVPFAAKQRLAVGTRDVVVTMRMARSIAPVNDGYVDNVSLVLDAPSPTARPDNADTTQGVAVMIEPSTNDSPGAGATIVAESVRLFEDDLESTSFSTAEGTYELDVANGDVVFEPVPSFLGTTHPLRYRITDTSGQQAVSTISITVTADPPVAVNDASLKNTMGTPVDVDVVVNDEGSVVVDSVILYDPTLDVLRPTPYVVPGQGRWSVESDGVVRFTPEDGFLVDPTPIVYRVSDANGLTDTATITISYLPEASDDLSSGNALGSRVTVAVLANDRGDFDPESVRLVSPNTGVPVEGDLMVAGEGTWAVDSSDGSASFAPSPTYSANPTPVDYQVTDTTDDTVGATITVTFVPRAANDSSAANAPGTSVTVDVAGNDSGDLRANTVVLIDPHSGDRVTQLVVAGEGTWTVDPVTGAITFEPQVGFSGNPNTIRYEIEDSAGSTASALVTIRYLATAANGAGGRLATTGVDVSFTMLVIGLLLTSGIILTTSARSRSIRGQH